MVRKRGLLESGALVLLAIATACVGGPYRTGKFNMSTGDYEAAVVSYTQAITTDPLHFPAFFFRGLAYEQLKAYEEAYRDYSRAIEIVTRFGAAYLARGRLMALQDRHEKAVLDFDRAIEFAGAVVMDEAGFIFALDRSDAFYDRGLSKLELRDYNRAIEDFDRTLALDAGYARAYRGRGLARLGRGEQRPGCDDLAKSCELGFQGSCTLSAERCP